MAPQSQQEKSKKTAHTFYLTLPIYHETAPWVEPFWLHFFSQCNALKAKQIDTRAGHRQFSAGVFGSF